MRSSETKKLSCVYGAREPLTHLVAERLAVDSFALQKRFRRFYHRAHLLRRIRAGFLDGSLDGMIHFRIGWRRRKIRLDHRDFFLLFVGQLLPAAAREHLDRFATLLDERLQNLQYLGVFERPNFFYFF